MPDEKPDHRLNLRGKVCPYPTLETRLALKKMRTDEVLEVISDYYPARQTIPDLVFKLGYSCELIEGGETDFRIVIRKGS